jgi:hypothetical protein
MAPPDSGLPIAVAPSAPPRIGTRLTLHLGVLVQSYRERGLTTADVAQFLEKEYALMATFYKVHEREIAEALEESLAGAIETLVMRRQFGDPWAGGMQRIQQQFREFISTKEAERVGIPNTPTLAALRGVNHRLKHPYAKSNPRRPSFRDTGLLMASFRSWIS